MRVIVSTTRQFNQMEPFYFLLDPVYTLKDGDKPNAH